MAHGVDTSDLGDRHQVEQQDIELTTRVLCVQNTPHAHSDNPTASIMATDNLTIDNAHIAQILTPMYPVNGSSYPFDIYPQVIVPNGYRVRSAQHKTHNLHPAL